MMITLKNEWENLWKLTVLHENVSVHLNYCNLCSPWIWKMLTDAHNIKQIGNNSALTLISNSRWSRSTTQSTEKQKLKTKLSAQKIMSTVFWHRKGIVLVEPLPRVENINAEQYWENFGSIFKTKVVECSDKALYCFMATHVPILLVLLKTLLKNFDGSSFITCHTALISWLPLVLKLVDFGERCFVSDDNAKNCVQQWLSSMPASFYEEGIKCSFM